MVKLALLDIWATRKINMQICPHAHVRARAHTRVHTPVCTRAHTHTHTHTHKPLPPPSHPTILLTHIPFTYTHLPLLPFPPPSVCTYLLSGPRGRAGHPGRPGLPVTPSPPRCSNHKSKVRFFQQLCGDHDEWAQDFERSTYRY